MPACDPREAAEVRERRLKNGRLLPILQVCPVVLEYVMHALFSFLKMSLIVVVAAGLAVTLALLPRSMKLARIRREKR